MAIDLRDKPHTHGAGTPVHATIVFVDIVGSTEELARLEREGWRDALDEARDALDAALERICQCIREFAGTVARVQGDGVMAIFGAPAATENHAFNACCAALKLRDLFRALALAPAPDKFTEIRIGIHSGRVLTRVRFNDLGSDYDVIGHDANLAKKVEEKCPPNAVLMTLASRDLAGAAVLVRPWDEDLFELLGIALHYDLSHQFAHDDETPLVGRREILDLLLAKVEAARSSKARPIAVVGEAGIGKSRLLYELSKEAKAAGVRVEQLRGHAVHALTPFAPVKPFILSLLGVAADADVGTIASSPSACGLSPGQQQGILELVGGAPSSDEWNKLDAPSRRRAMLEAVVALVAKASSAGPLLLIAEDVHDFDAETNDLLAALKSLSTKAPVMIVATVRSVARDVALGIADEVVDLRPLTPEQSWQLAQALAAGAGIGPDDVARAVANAAGNPLFLQGLMRDLRSGKTGEGTPASVTSLVQARMSRLSDKSKEALWAASVLRSGFDRRILASAAGVDEPALDPLLDELRRQHLIDVDDAGGVFFRHDLFRAAVDDLLLRGQRRELHRRAKLALEPLGRTPERLEQLAYHSEMAGEFHAALACVLEACRLAVRSSSLRTVRALYAWAKKLRERATSDALPAFVSIAVASFDALQQSGDVAEYRAALELVIEHAGHTRDRRSEALARAHLALLCWMQAKHDEGHRHGEIALGIARDLDSLELRALAQPHLANIEHARGNVDRAIALHAEIVEALEGEYEKSTLGRMIIPSVRSRAFLAWFLVERGRFADAQAQIERGEAILKENDQPYSRVLLNAARGLLAMRSGRPHDAIAPLERARDLCLSLLFYAMEPAVSGWLASALVRIGEPARALEIAQQSIDTKRYMHGGRYTWVYVHQALAEAQFACGATATALETIARALAIAEESKEPIQIAQARFARAQMFADLSVKARALDDVAEALCLAEKHDLNPLAADCRRLRNRIGPE